MSKNLEDAGIALASSSVSKGKQGDVYLDRTIYYTVELTDSEGRVIVDKTGNPIIENRAYLTAGRWITESMMKEALEVEKRFARLNKLFRDDMETKDMKWRLKKSDIKAMEIPGIL